MDPKLKTNFTSRLINAIESLSSQNFPAVAKIIIEHKYKIQFELRGQTITGEPVGHTLDANTSGYADVAEFGVTADYFNKPFKKIFGDFKHCLRVARHCQRMFLMSSRTCGPKNYAWLNDIAARWGKKLGKDILILDGRWLATYIIDQILESQDITTLELLEPHLAYIAQIHTEFGYSHDLPTLPKDNWPRPEAVDDILALLDEHSYIQINGLSGMGKTYLAVQVFNELKRVDSERMIIWIPGNTVSTAESLSSLRIERYAVPQNILGLIKRFKCVVVIDSLESYVEDVVQRIKAVGAPDYRLIISSQTQADLDSVYSIPPSDDELSNKILNASLQKPCPQEIYKQIIKAIGGHPFLLDQINILVKKEQLSWVKVLRETDTLTTSSFDNQAFYDRLFVHHLKTTALELGVLKWIDTKEIDESLLLTLIGKSGITKLKARNFFNAYRDGAFVLHDIVLNSLRITTIPFDEMLIERKLAGKLAELYHRFDADYYRIIHAHKKLIVRSLEKIQRHDIYNYSYLISVPLADYDKRIVPSTSNEDLALAFKNFRADDYFLIMSWIEQTEKEFRIIKAHDRDQTASFLAPRIKTIEDLLANSNRLTAAVKRDIRNHLGKFLRDINDRARAIQVFESILIEEPNFWAAKFHLAKLYRKDRAKEQQAQRFLAEIIDAYNTESQISPTIVLASFKEIRSHNMDQLLLKFIDSFAQLLEQTMVSRFDQPYEVLGALSSRIQFKMPERMISLASMLPIPAEDAIENHTLFDVGMIYLNTGKAYQQLGQPEKANEYYRQGTAYYAKLSEASDFQLRGIAEAYLLLKDPDTSLEQLSNISDDKNEWYNYTLSKTLRMLGRFDEAKDAIDAAINKNTNDKNISTFHRERGAIRQAQKDEHYHEDYNYAIKHCADQQFIDIMNEELRSYTN